MKKILVLSDTHSYIDDRILHYVHESDQVWHAGDIGSIAVADQIAAHKPLFAVYGNIDNSEIRNTYPLWQRFVCEGLSVWITHIAGYPPRYNTSVRDKLSENPPNLLLSGHSHILKVMRDPSRKLLYMNPGAAGKHGFHKVRTMLRFDIQSAKIENLEVIELGTR